MKPHIRLVVILSIVLLGCDSKKETSAPQEGLSVGLRTAPDTMNVPPGAISRPDEVYRFDPEQLAAVNSLLADSVNWRLAVDSDNTNGMLEKVRKEVPTYRPYYMRSDIDQDGKLDFAVALIRDSTISLFWFSKTDSDYAKARYVARATWFDECGYEYKPQSGRFYFGMFYSDVGVFLHWDSVQQDLQTPSEPDEDNQME